MKTAYTKQDPSSIRSLFDNIAPRYDLGNALLSFQLHRLWNRRLANTLSENRPQACLDLCCGTGEIAARLIAKHPNSHFCLVDFSEQMLLHAKQRIRHTHTRFIQADAQALPLDSGAFDVVSIAYGIRNVQMRDICFSEVYRVLKRGGWIGIVELTRPTSFLMNLLHKLYLKTMVPLMGKAITSNKEAYSYLCKSIETFVSPQELALELKSAGFRNIRIEPQNFGIATLLFAQKI